MVINVIYDKNSPRTYAYLCNDDLGNTLKIGDYVSVPVKTVTGAELEKTAIVKEKMTFIDEKEIAERFPFKMKQVIRKLTDEEVRARTGGAV